MRSRVYTCVHARAYAFTRVHMRSRVYGVHMSSRPYTCLHVRTHAFTCVHMRSRAYTCVHLCTHAFTSVHVCSRAYTCVHVRAHKETALSPPTRKDPKNCMLFNSIQAVDISLWCARIFTARDRSAEMHLISSGEASLPACQIRAN